RQTEHQVGIRQVYNERAVEVNLGEIMLSKDQKIKFVKDGSKELSKYSTIGIVNLTSIPDRLLQRSRNGMKGDMKMILGRRNLLVKILESSEKSKKLVEKMSGTSAIVMSNADPF